MPPSWKKLGINDPTQDRYLSAHFPAVTLEGSKASGRTRPASLVMASRECGRFTRDFQSGLIREGLTGFTTW